jgi:hypothetical protein
VSGPKIIFRVHTVQRMFERQISVRNVVQVLQAGETIEDYSSEMQEPSRLILGFRGSRPLHIVVSENPTMDAIIIITAYIPDPVKWDKGFRSRRA